MAEDQARTRKVAIEATISHIVDIIGTAARGAEKGNREASQAMKGVASAILKSSDQIVKQVSERLGDNIS